MKTKKRLLSLLALVLIFVAGYALGLVLNVPDIESEQLGGTIAKVSNYRNTKASEADIALKNELLNDTTQRKIVSAYLNYYYAKSAAYASSLNFAIDQSAAVQGFASQDANTAAVSNYLKFLQESRKDLLMASLQCQAVENADPAVLRNSLNQANNVIARMNQANAILVDYIDQLDNFLQINGPSAYPQLCQAHDQLVMDQLGGLLISRDKLLMKYFDKKRLYTQGTEEEPFDFRLAVIRDLQKLNTVYPYDMEKLGLMDKEMLSLLDKEELGGYYDNEKLGLKEADELGFLDDENLGKDFKEVEQLGVIFREVEQLGFVFDSEKLGTLKSGALMAGALMDTEKLGTLKSGALMDAEQLAYYVFDSEKLGTLKDLEQLGAGFPDSEKLGGIMALDSEKLGMISF